MGGWKRVAVTLLVLSALGVAALLFFQPGRNNGTDKSNREIADRNKQAEKDHILQITNRIARLKQKVEKARNETPAYSPKTPGNIDDLAISPADILRQLPGVAQVEILVTAGKPTHRIIQIQDWHTVPKELFALDMKEAHKRVLSQDEIDLLHQELLLEAELVQMEQVALLRCLAKHHGLKRVFSESLTKDDLPTYRQKVAGLQGVEADLTKRLAEVRKLKKGEKAQAIEKQLTDLLEQYRQDVLVLGSPGQLLIAMDIEEVLPLDDAGLLDQAKPISPDGRVKPDPEKIQLRRDGQVKLALAHGPVALVVLGGSHDLSESVRRLGKGSCEYIRVTTKSYQEITNDGSHPGRS